MDTAEAIQESVTAGDIVNSAGDPADMIDAFRDLEFEVGRVADAITSYDVSTGGDEDSCGNHVTSLTEAVVGMTSGLVKIANAIESLANAVAYR